MLTADTVTENVSAADLARFAARAIARSRASADAFLDAALAADLEDEVRWNLSMLCAAAERTIEYKHHTLGYIRVPNRT